MEKFYKIHRVQKRSSKVQSIDKNLKNKFKLMLHGYKHNDKNAIRSAVELPSQAGDSDTYFTLDEDSDLDETSLTPSSTDSSTSSPARSPVRSSSLAHTSPFVSPTEAEDLGRMMRAINDILDSDSEVHTHKESFAEINTSDPDSSVPEINTYDLVDTSLEPSNTSSSSHSEFDGSGELASCILGKLNARNTDPHEESKREESVAPSASGYITVLKRKRQSSIAKPKKGPVPKIGKLKKLKKVHKEDSPTYISLDASKEDLPNFLSSFRDYNFSTSKNISPKVFYSRPNSTDYFHKIPKLSKAEINEYHEERNSDSVSYDSGGSHPVEQHVSEDSKEYINSSEQLDDSKLIYDDVTNPEHISIDDATLNYNERNTEPININDSTYYHYGDENIDEIIPMTSVQIHRLRNSCIMVLRHPTQVYLHGKIKVSSLCGTVDIMGYKLQGSTTRVYAPRFTYAHTLRTVATECSQYGLFAKLTALGMSVLGTEDIVVSLKEFDSVIHLEPLMDKKLDFLEKEFTSAEVFRMSNRQLMYEQFPEAAEMLSCSLYTDKPYKSFAENAIWPEVVKHGIGNKNSKGIICGGKGTGKSTFLKYYINSMLSQGPVLVIDLDPGQSEFTVAGNIAITIVKDPVVGPNFTHLQEPRRMLHLGLINVLDNIERYTSAVAQLLSHAMAEDEYSRLPWIVNTMGMSNSIGLKLITYIILLMKPTFLVQMDSKVQNKCFEMLLTSQEIMKIYSESYEEDKMFENTKCPEDLNFKYFMSSHLMLSGKDNLTAKDYRYLSFLSYFGGVLSRINDSLLGSRPYVVQLKSLRIATSCKVDEDAITSVINGKIVALCEDNSIPLGKMFTLEENALICHGHGVIRGVDLDTESVYIITPERMEVVSRVNVLVYCESNPELELDTGGLSPGTLVPYRAPLRPHNKNLLKLPKRRFNPLQLLKMKKLGSQN